MLFEIIILILLSLFQVSLIPLDLVLIFLICRSFLTSDRANFYLAFGFGLIVSLMQGGNLGLTSLIYIISVQVVQLIKKSEFSNHFLSIIPISLVIFSLEALASLALLGSPINFSQIIFEVVLSLPGCLFLKFWQERFTPDREVRLKMKG